MVENVSQRKWFERVIEWVRRCSSACMEDRVSNETLLARVLERVGRTFSNGLIE